jgi:Uma2 family endonuclease
MNRPLIDVQIDHKARFTTAEFLRMVAAGAFEDMKVELVEGELERMNPPMSEHGRLQMDVGYRLRRIFDGHATIRVFGETGIALGPDTVRACDAVVVRAAPEADRLLRPDEILLVIEIAESTLARDLGPKRIDYARAGIPHYWVVDGDRSVVHLYADPVAGEYADICSIRFGAPMPVPGTGATITLD